MGSFQGRPIRVWALSEDTGYTFSNKRFRPPENLFGIVDFRACQPSLYRSDTMTIQEASFVEPLLEAGMFAATSYSSRFGENQGCLGEGVWPTANGRRAV